MKNYTERDTYVFDLWDKKGLTFAEIAELEIPSLLSIKRIRNVVYGGPKKAVSPREKEIYSAFRMKFLELKDVREAILYVAANQPSHKIKERQIRNIINRQLAFRREALAKKTKQ